MKTVISNDKIMSNLRILELHFSLLTEKNSNLTEQQIKVAHNVIKQALIDWIPEKTLPKVKQIEKRIIEITKRTVVTWQKPYYTKEEQAFLSSLNNKEYKKLKTIEIEAENKVIRIAQGHSSANLNVTEVFEAYSDDLEKLLEIINKPRKESRIKFRTKVWRISLNNKDLLILEQKVKRELETSNLSPEEIIEGKFSKELTIKALKTFKGLEGCFD